MYNKTTITENDRTFEIEIWRDCGDYFGICICEVVRPNWIIFRTRYLRDGYFDFDSYNSIDEVIRYFLDKQYAREKYEKDTEEKISKFFTKNT